MFDRYVIELPIINGLNIEEWYNRVQDCYFFKNQSQIFDCFLTIMNKKLYLSFNTKSALSRSFMEFVIYTLPTKQKDKKRRFFRLR